MSVDESSLHGCGDVVGGVSPGSGAGGGEARAEALSSLTRNGRVDAEVLEAGLAAAPASEGGRGTAMFSLEPRAEVVTIPSIVGETAIVGRFDDEQAPVAVVDSHSVLHYPDTLSAFGGRVGRETTVDDVLRWRAENAPWGPHTVVGPVAVSGAEPGDVVELRILQMDPVDHAVNYCLPRHVGLGAMPDDHPAGSLRVMEIDTRRRRLEFGPGIGMPVRPFPGILGVTPPAPGRHNTVPPGRFGGNLDLRELTVGSRLFVPVWRPGAGIWLGDFHALQGDGEINLTAAETAMAAARIQVVLHKGTELHWPFAETPTHWVSLGMGASFEEAFAIAARMLRAFLVERAGLDSYTAYSLLSIAASFRITQVVNASYGVHGMLAKALFDPEIRQAIGLPVPVTEHAPEQTRP